MDRSPDIVGPRKRARLRHRLLLLAGTILVLGGAGELGLRWVRPDLLPPEGRESTELFQAYAPHGYRLWPSRATTYHYPNGSPRELSMVSNAAGFRSRRELDEPDPRLRIVVLGDSFVFGQGVEENERFTEVLESLEPGWRIDNLGMTGYGPDLMLFALEAVGVVLKPRVVVFCIWTADFPRVHPLFMANGFRSDRVTTEDGRAVRTSYPDRHWWDRSHLYQAVARLWWKWSTGEYRVTEAILDRFRELSTQRAFAPALVFLPSSERGERHDERRTWLAAYARQKGIPFLDLTDPIHQAGVKQVFIPADCHFNALGHRIVADELRRFLIEQVLKAR